ncbi:unnamed protein product, partial [Closterium sp. NIES-53]
VCVAGVPLGAVACGSVRSRAIRNTKYTVQLGDTCGSLILNNFKRNATLVPTLNRGWICRPNNLFRGMPLCVPI